MRTLSFIIKKTCNDETRYEFLLSPRLHTVANVVSYTPDNFDYMNRFLSIHMPIKALFDFKNSIIALTHEAGHFLPNNKLRCRKSRMHYLLKSIITAIGIELRRGMVNDNIGSDTIEYFKNVLNDVNQSVLLQIIACQNEETKYYLKYSEKLIRDTIIEFFKSNQNIITANLPNKELSSQLRNNIVTLLQNNNNLSINIMYLNLEKVLRECYSDLFVIKILGLNFNDYYQAIQSTTLLNDSNKFELSEFLTIRIALMIKVNHWDITGYNEKCMEPVKDIIELLKNEKSTAKIDLLSGMQNKTIFKNIEEYLTDCSVEMDKTLLSTDCMQIIQKCFEKINKVMNDNDISLLIKILESFDNQQNIFETLDPIMKEIEKYKVSLYEI